MSKSGQKATAASTIVILLGASHYPLLASERSRLSFLKSSNAFKEYLVDVFGLPTENVLDLFDSEDEPSHLARRISQFITSVTDASEAEMPRDLLLYYVGHGDFTEDQRTYYLYLKNTDEKLPQNTALPVRHLREALSPLANGIRHHLIVDACFSGRVVDAFQSPVSKVMGRAVMQEFPASGVSVLCSSHRDRTSLAPPENEFTMFGEAFSHSLANGAAELGTELSMNDVATLCNTYLNRTYPEKNRRPEIHVPEQGKGMVNQVPLFFNPARTLTVSKDLPVKSPHFECEDVVIGADFINRKNKLEQAMSLINRGKRFMLVGAPRVGKSCFCAELMNRIRRREGNDILVGRMDLDAIDTETIDAFLGHTIIYMLGEAAWALFKIQYANLRQDLSHVAKPLRKNTEYLQMRNLCTLVETEVFYDAKQTSRPLTASLFIQYTRDLLRIIRNKGWSRFVMFYDEANNMEDRMLSVKLLASNAKLLADSNLSCIFVASQDMADQLDGHEQSLGQELYLGPFESPVHMKQLLARYYFGDVSRIDELPIVQDALDKVWEYSKGIPFLMQHIFNSTFRIGHERQAAIIDTTHVEQAMKQLAKERQRYFGASHLNRG